MRLFCPVYPSARHLSARVIRRVLVNSLKLLSDEHCQVTAHVMLLVLSLWTALGQAAEMAARGFAYVKVLAHYMHLAGASIGVVVSIIGIVQK